MTAAGGGLRKGSVTLDRHRTSLSLEPVFWDLLRAEAAREGLALAALVARIDRARAAQAPPANLSSAVRVYLVEALLARLEPGESPGQAG